MGIIFYLFIFHEIMKTLWDYNNDNSNYSNFNLSSYYGFLSDIKSYDLQFQFPQELAFMRIDSADALFDGWDNLETFIDYYIRLNKEGDKNELFSLLEEYLNLFNERDREYVYNKIKEEQLLIDFENKNFESLYEIREDNFGKFNLDDPLVKSIEDNKKLKERRVIFCSTKKIFSALSSVGEKRISSYVQDFMRERWIVWDVLDDRLPPEVYYLEQGHPITDSRNIMKNVNQSETLDKLYTYFYNLSDYDKVFELIELAYLAQKNNDDVFKNRFSSYLKDKNEHIKSLWDMFLYQYSGSQYDFAKDMCSDIPKHFESPDEAFLTCVKPFLENLRWGEVPKEYIGLWYSIIKMFLPLTKEFEKLHQYLDEEYNKFKNNISSWTNTIQHF